MYSPHLLGALGTTEVSLLLVLIAGYLALPVIAILDIVGRQFRDGSNKIIWALTVLILPWPGHYCILPGDVTPDYQAVRLIQDQGLFTIWATRSASVAILLPT